MHKLGLIGFAVALAVSPAAAEINFTPPPLVLGGSTVAACAQAISLSFPIPLGATVYNCMVLPSSWTGTVTPAPSGGLAAPYAVGPVIGNTFTVITTAIIPGPTAPVPGALISNP